MFGFRGGETDENLARLTGYRADAQQRWPTLTYLDLSQIKTEAQLDQDRGAARLQDRRALQPVSGPGAGRRDRLDGGQDLLAPRRRCRLPA
jgi:hypothetical protein